MLRVLALLALLGGAVAGLAHGERSQHGNLVVSLDGGLSPLKLPRDRLAPVTVRLEGGLQTADGSLLPRVTRVELGLPKQGVLSTRGLPVCPRGRLHDTKSAEALSACGAALVGWGKLEAQVQLPNQAAFAIHARLLAFNAQVRGHRAVVLHATATSPPTSVVLPFLLEHRDGRLGTALVANLPPALGPWPHLARFEITLSRRFAYRGRNRSFLSASCPIPRRFTAGFFSFARATFTLADGRRVGTGIPRSCRAS